MRDKRRKMKDSVIFADTILYIFLVFLVFPAPPPSHFQSTESSVGGAS